MVNHRNRGSRGDAVHPASPDLSGVTSYLETEDGSATRMRQSAALEETWELCLPAKSILFWLSFSSLFNTTGEIFVCHALSGQVCSHVRGTNLPKYESILL
ncbi:MAG TPA: hypothetical protein VLH18_07665 [Candidatus Limnocylindrales bacterium]|nr:hypothetical protein [Candidatus Limnocylindrales bacterium]